MHRKVALALAENLESSFPWFSPIIKDASLSGKSASTTLTPEVHHTETSESELILRYKDRLSRLLESYAVNKNNPEKAATAIHEIMNYCKSRKMLDGSIIFANDAMLFLDKVEHDGTLDADKIRNHRIDLLLQSKKDDDLLIKLLGERISNYKSDNLSKKLHDFGNICLIQYRNKRFDDAIDASKKCLDLINRLDSVDQKGKQLNLRARANLKVSIHGSFRL